MLSMLEVKANYKPKFSFLKYFPAMFPNFNYLDYENFHKFCQKLP